MNATSSMPINIVNVARSVVSCHIETVLKTGENVALREKYLVFQTFRSRKGGSTLKPKVKLIDHGENGEGN